MHRLRNVHDKVGCDSIASQASKQLLGFCDFVFGHRASSQVSDVLDQISSELFNLVPLRSFPGWETVSQFRRGIVVGHWQKLTTSLTSNPEKS
jgi:hypothetical protein